MRELADEAHIDKFIRAPGRAARSEGRLYLTGGATAVLHGWRESTIDVDINLVPDSDELLREIPKLKERPNVNVKLAAPSDFIPVPEGWEERSPLVRRAVERATAQAFPPLSGSTSMKTSRSVERQTGASGAAG